MKTLKTLILFSFLFVCGMNASADNKSNLIYNSEEVNGMKVAETVYKMDGSTLANYMKYNYKYDDQKRITESEALKWNAVKNAWTHDMCIRYAYEGMKKIPGVNILGSDDPDKHCGILSFTVDGVHPHDIATILDSCHVDVRAGHHCAQPLLAYLGVRSCARASLAFYNPTAAIDRFLAALGGVRKEMGYAE